MIRLLKGDITALEVDAIVNAANKRLAGGGGVDAAIHRAGGPQILRECQQYIAQKGELPTGEAMYTSGGELAAPFVIHTVGPVWNGGQKSEDQLLAACYINSLHIAFEEGWHSIAFPNISTGVYGYPKEEAAEVAIATVSNFLNSDRGELTVSFVCFDDENFKIYQRLLHRPESTGKI